MNAGKNKIGRERKKGDWRTDRRGGQKKKSGEEKGRDERKSEGEVGRIG